MECKDMQLKLSKIILVINIACKYYLAENKVTLLQKKLYESHCNSSNRLFSNYKLPVNAKPIQTMKKKLFDRVYPEMKCQANIFRNMDSYIAI